jgi:hypothetical protein
MHYPPMPPPQNMPPKPRNLTARTLAISGGITAFVLILVAIIAVTVHPSQPQQQVTGQIPDITETSDAPEPEMPTVKDFTVSLKTTSKQCFGSAGCSVEVMPDIAYSGLADLNGLSCDVTYEITGDESGTVIETAHGDGTSVSLIPSSLSTSSNSTEVEAKVSDVSCY